ncbi:MAG: cytochrome c family protein [Bacteroidetes bacterium]|nr:cytochrome c family protein [Bacteroidota bacterium]
MLKKVLVLPVIAAAFMLMAFEYGSSPVKGENEYIGSKKCGMCHKKDNTGNQLAIWEKSAHAKAFEVLSSDAGKAIAKEKGIADPQKAAACLKCHATGQHEGAKFDTKFEIADGVQCEACHGAGSEYKAMKVMKDHAASVAAGMTDYSVKGSAKAQCATCHENTEIHPTNKDFDYEKNWAKISHMIPKG